MGGDSAPTNTVVTHIKTVIINILFDTIVQFLLLAAEQMDVYGVSGGVCDLINIILPFYIVYHSFFFFLVFFSRSPLFCLRILSLSLCVNLSICFSIVRLHFPLCSPVSLRLCFSKIMIANDEGYDPGYYSNPSKGHVCKVDPIFISLHTSTSIRIEKTSLFLSSHHR